MPSDYNPNETARDWEAFQKNESGDRTERIRVAGGWLYARIIPGADPKAPPAIGVTFAPSATGE